MVLEKDGDHSGQSCEKYSPREEEYPTDYKEKEG
jgi:hypothetical protein